MWSFVSNCVGTTREFVHRHRRKILLGSVIGSAITGYYVYHKVKPIIDEIRESLKVMEELNKQFVQSSPGESHKETRLNFERNMQAADITLRKFACGSMQRYLTRRFNVSEIRQRLSKSRGKKVMANLDTWNQLIEQGIARTVAAIYGVCFMNAVLHIQLTILARYVLVDSHAVQSIASPDGQAYDTTRADNAFLDISRHTQDTGLKLLCEELFPIVQRVVSRYELGSEMTEEDMSALLADIRRDFESRLFGTYRCCLGDSNGDDVSSIDAIDAIDADTSVDATSNDENKHDESIPISLVSPASANVRRSIRELYASDYSEDDDDVEDDVEEDAADFNGDYRFSAPAGARIGHGKVLKVLRQFRIPAVSEQRPLYFSCMIPDDIVFVDRVEPAEDTIERAQQDDSNTNTNTNTNTNMNTDMNKIADARLFMADRNSSYAPYRGEVKFAEMVEEMRGVLCSESFRVMLNASFEAAFGVLLSQAQPASAKSAPGSGRRASMAFAKYATCLARTFKVLLPTDSDKPAPLFQALQNLPEVRRVCSIVYYPLGEDGELKSDACATRDEHVLRQSEQRVIVQQLMQNQDMLLPTGSDFPAGSSSDHDTQLCHFLQGTQQSQSQSQSHQSLLESQLPRADEC